MLKRGVDRRERIQARTSRRERESGREGSRKEGKTKFRRATKGGSISNFPSKADRSFKRVTSNCDEGS